MVQLVSLDQASNHLRRDTTDDNSDLLLKIEAASQAVLNYIDDYSFLDSAGEVDPTIPVPRPIQAAVLIILGDLYVNRDAPEYREGGSAPRLGEITLPRTVHFLLDSYRTPIIC
jgi:hypothetical protein